MSETEGAAAVAEEQVEAPEPQLENAGADTVPDEVVERMEEEEAVAAAVPAPIADARTPGRQARVYLCERGHRTDSLWSTPTLCHARPVRSGPECGRQLYPIGDLPEQVQKALNPLKASKKAAKK
ncbi:MAG: hypothetical protein QOD86_2495 [Miltoncostaeaceae bacterium]|jgi:hypothetical protein|nr:hypothetical protein [Miltoncostaeaceae bacterium]